LNEELIGVALDLLVGAYFDEGKLYRAIQTADLISQRSPDSESEYMALFNLFNIYKNALRDEESATVVLAEMKDKYPDYELTLLALEESGEIVNWALAKRFEGEDPILAKNEPVPDYYALRANYPNPFNPITTITYDLPEDAHVKLVIYDILGREVRSWNFQQVPGYHQVVWDSRDQSGQLLSSGVYIYRLRATSSESGERFTTSKKMLLIK